MPENTKDILIPAGTAQRLLSAHDGDMALLWLFSAATGSSDVEAAAAALCRTGSEIRSASEKLGRMGLLPYSSQPSQPAETGISSGVCESVPVSGAAGSSSRSVPLPSDEIPEYTAADITAASQAGTAFSAIVDEAVRVRGQFLNTVDLKTLFGIYDYYGLPADVIFLLLNYCAETNTERNGHGRRLSMNYIKAEAVRWVNANITDCERAEEYIRNQKEYRAALNSFKRALGIFDRDLVPTERSYISEWMGMGFAPDAVAVALDRTVSRCGKRELKYMNAIIRRWHENGLHTVAEIEAADSAPRGSSVPAPSGQGSLEIDLDALARELDKRI